MLLCYINLETLKHENLCFEVIRKCASGFLQREAESGPLRRSYRNRKLIQDFV